jgi:PAS domain S-box-containing protein
MTDLPETLEQLNLENVRLRERVAELERIAGAASQGQHGAAFVMDMVFEASLAAESVADANGRIHTVNGAFLRLWGYEDRTCVVEKTVADFFADPEDAVPVLHALDETGCWQGEFLAQRKDGTTFLSQGYASSLRDVKGKLLGYVSTNLDITDMRRAEQELRAAKENFQLLADLTHSWDYWIDNDGSWAYCSPSAVHITGYLAEEFLAEPLLLQRIIHPLDRPLFDQHCAELETHRTCQEVQLRIVHKDGSVRWIAHGCWPILDGHRRCRGRRGTNRDITAERTAALRVERDEATIRAIMESAASPIFCLDREYRYTCFNRAHAAVMKALYGADITLGERFLGYMTVELDRGLAQVNVDRALSGEDFTDSKYSGEDHRTCCYFEIEHAPVRDVDGSIIGVSVFARDVTESKRAWDAVSQAREFLSGVIDSLSAHICVLDQTGVIVETNRAWREFAAANPPAPSNAVEGSNYFAVCDDVTGPERETAQAFVRGLRDVLADRQALFEMEYACHSPTTERWFVGRATRFVGEGNYIVVVHTDITSQKKLLSQLSQAERLATMGMLAAGIAHEINNPLSYVLYNIQSTVEEFVRFSEILRHPDEARSVARGSLSEEPSLATGVAEEPLWDYEDTVRRLRDALAGAIQIKEIARSLGTFSRVETTEAVPTDLRQPILHAINMAHNEIKYRARMVTELARTPPILGSDGKLAQVFLNLLINAAHAIGTGDIERHEIRVRTWKTAIHVCAEVSDTGPGIPVACAARLFEPFFTTKAPGVGSGLGLSICKNIVDSFGGDISFASEPGHGARFLVRFPLLEEQELSKMGSVRPPSGQAVALRGRVLVVDDDEGVLASLRHMLGRDHDVVTAVSGTDARAVLQADQTFDLLFVDLMMPHMSGMQLHDWLVVTYPNLAPRVIFITGGAFTLEARHYLAQVTNLRLEKPLDATNTRTLANELILGRRKATNA